MMAKLLTMVNANVAEINRNDPKGELASEGLSLPGISRAEFMNAMSSVAKMKSARAEDFNQQNAPTPAIVAQGKGTVSSDVTVLLRSIESILQNIQQVLLSLVTTQPK